MLNKSLKNRARELERLHNSLTQQGKDLMWHMVYDLGVDPFEAMVDILTTHQDLVKFNNPMREK